MKLTKNFVKGLTATAALAGVATPLTMITSCSCSKNKDFAVDVTNGYTPSEKWKSKVTEEATLSKMFDDWFRFVEINPGLPNEEFRWTIGEMAKKVNNLNADLGGIAITGKMHKATAGIKDFVIEDHLAKTVSFEIKGSFDFSIYGDGSQAEGSFNNTYQADIDYSFDVKVHNLPLTQDDGSGMAFTAMYMASEVASYIQQFWKNLGPIFNDLSEKVLNICPDVQQLFDKNDWWIEFDTKGVSTLVENDKEIDSALFGGKMSIDYETIWAILSFPMGGQMLLQFLPLAQSLMGWRSFYSSQRPIIKFATRVAIEDEDLEQPLSPNTDAGDGWFVGFQVSGTAEEWEANVSGLNSLFNKITTDNMTLGLTASVEYDPQDENKCYIIYELIPDEMPSEVLVESVYVPLINANEQWFHVVEVPLTTGQE